MACEFCTDPDGLPCFPQYGIAPHLYGTGPGFRIGTFFKPREFWPSNFQEDPENPNHGTYWCPECGDGKPKNEPEKATEMEVDLDENRLAELERLPNTASPAVVRELVHRLREAGKTAERMREALQTIAGMQDRAYYKVCPNETAKDAHLIAFGALAEQMKGHES